MNALRHADPTAKIAPADLATYLQQMRDQERGDLARELHDELGSLLTGAKLEVASLKHRLDGASTDIVQRLTHLSATINSGIAFSRRVVEGLHPSSLKNLGLAASLEILAREFRQRTGIAMATDLEELDLDAASQLTAYRVVQESLNNTSKYAKATDAHIVMLNCGADVIVSVRDNGSGFETAAVGTASHGLAGMRHRVAACGGQLTVCSAPGRGTMLVAVLPRQAGQCAPPRPALLACEPKEVPALTPLLPGEHVQAVSLNSVAVDRPMQDAGSFTVRRRPTNHSRSRRVAR